LFDVDLVWLTDQGVPNREGLGLMSHMLKCDRLEYQYVVTSVDGVEPWLGSAVRAALCIEPGFSAFEEGRQPETWWIAQRPVWAVRNSSLSRTYIPSAPLVAQGLF
jgi:hypothetical protein